MDVFTGAYSILLGGNSTSLNAITSLDVDGFSWGTTLGADTTEFHWVCFGADDGFIETGTYAGNGVDDRVLNLGASSLVTTFFLTVPDNSGRASVRYWGDAAIDDSFASMWANGGAFANQIQEMHTGSVELGTTTNVNGDGINYAYLAMGTASQVQQLDYTGNGVDGRTIATNFEPVFALIKRYDGGIFDQGQGILKFDTLGATTDLAWHPADFRGAGFELADHIQSWNGSTITLGLNSNVNGNTFPYRGYIIQDSPGVVTPIIGAAIGGGRGAGRFALPISPYTLLKSAYDIRKRFRDLQI